MGPVALLLLTLSPADRSHLEDAEQALSAGQAALRKDALEESAEHAQRALAVLEVELRQSPKDPRAWLLRGRAHDLLGRHKEAVADFSRVLELDPKAVEALDLRGGSYFKLGKVDESLADFDRYLKVRPEASAGHWRRGIALYYAGKYDEGRRQFEGYEKLDANDVENAVWHFLCVARKGGVTRARASLLKVGKDARVPMAEVYALFAGRARPEDVLRAAAAGKPTAAERNRRFFYAHLYLGLYCEATGDAGGARRHLGEAADKHRVGHYMWDVARVHRDRLQQK